MHDYLTVDGTKISKSIGNGVAPAELVERFGTDAVRWWLLSESPLGVDADFTVDRLVRRANDDLANGLGNLVSAYGRARAPSARRAGSSRRRRRIDDDVDVDVDADFADALDVFDLRRATRRLRELIDAANTELERVRPWELARTDPNDERIDEVLADVVARCRRWSRSPPRSCRTPRPSLRERIGTGATVGPPGRVFDRLDVPTAPA